MTHCAHCPPQPRLATVIRRKDLPRIERRLFMAVQCAKHVEWTAMHALHGGYSSKGSGRAKGSTERLALRLAADSRAEWVGAIAHLLNWSRS